MTLRSARDGGHVGPSHEPFEIHVRVEELAEERLELRDGLGRRQVERRAPAVDDDLPAAAVDRGDQAIRPDPVAQTRRAKSTSTIPSRKSADPRITFAAPSASVASARSRLRMPPPTRQGSAPQMSRDEPGVLARPLGGVQIDQLHFRAAAEPRDPRVDVAGLDGEPLALHELDDPAALEID